MKNESPLLILLTSISSVSVVLPFFIGLLRRKYLNSAEKIVLALMGLSLIIEAIGYIMMTRNTNNLYVYHIYTMVEFTLISFFYIRVLAPSRFTPVIFGVIFLFLGVATYDYLNKSESMDDLSTTTESIIVILYSVLGFHSLLQNPVQARVMDIPLFWFNAAFLLYFAGNLFLFIFSNYILRHNHHTFNELWGIHSVMNMIFYLLISTGFWKTKAR